MFPVEMKGLAYFRIFNNMDLVIPKKTASETGAQKKASCSNLLSKKLPEKKFSKLKLMKGTQFRVEPH